MHNLEYKERLTQLGMLSTERRTQWYKIVHCLKMVKYLVPSCGLIEAEMRPGKGQTLRVPKVQSKGKKVEEESFTVEDLMLFNSMPPKIRNFLLNKPLMP